MEKTGRAVSIDGVIVGAENAKVSVFDRGFLYGDSVFEVTRTYGGEPFALEEHLQRLRRSAQRVLITMPVSDDQLAREVHEAVASTGNDETYVRMMITRGSGPLGLDPDLAQKPMRVILAERLTPPPRENYERGIAVITVSTQRTVDGTAAEGAKVSNYLANLLAMREAKLRGASEAIVISQMGEVLEGASSNIFVLKNGALHTPAERAGILPGITRARVLEAAKELAIPSVLGRVELADLLSADEVFITSSIRELVPVVRVDDKPVQNGRPGAVVRALHKEFRKGTKLAATPMPWE